MCATVLLDDRKYIDGFSYLTYYRKIDGIRLNKGSPAIVTDLLRIELFEDKLRTKEYERKFMHKFAIFCNESINDAQKNVCCFSQDVLSAQAV